MQPVTRHDPSPSRLKYRVERLMLTPFFRFTLRVVLPCAVIAGAGALWFAQEDNRTAFNDMVAEFRDTVESRPEFQVKLMAIDGATHTVAEEVRAALNLSLPQSSFDLDLDDLQQKVVRLDAVETADIRVKNGGVLQVDVKERAPVLLMRTETSLSLLDAQGVFVGHAKSRLNHSNLPVIAGEDAMNEVPEALELFKAAAPLAERVRGLERMGARRWDVVLDRDQRILLPENDAVQALERIIAMDQAIEVLSRDITVVDLRLPQRPTIRMSKNATDDMWRIKQIEAGGVVE